MNITLKKLDEYTLDIFKLMAKWSNDEDIKPFSTPNMDGGELRDVSGEEFLEISMKNKNKRIFLIMDAEKPIGEMTVQKDFEMLTKKDERTAWISIAIGEKSYWGKGVGKTAMKLLEEECKKIGYNKIELGVFEFNERALKLYKSLGYKQIAIHNHFTYYNGSWYDDIRMIKNI